MSGSNFTEGWKTPLPSMLRDVKFKERLVTIGKYQHNQVSWLLLQFYWELVYDKDSSKLEAGLCDMIKFGQRSLYAVLNITFKSS